MARPRRWLVRGSALPSPCQPASKKKTRLSKGAFFTLETRSRSRLNRGRTSLGFAFAQRLLAKRCGSHQSAKTHRFDRRARHQHQRSLLLQTLVENVHRTQVERGGVVLIRLCCLEEQVRDFDFCLAEDDTRGFFTGRLRLARHRVLQRGWDDYVTHFHRLNRDAPWIGSLIDQRLQFRL